MQRRRRTELRWLAEQFPNAMQTLRRQHLEMESALGFEWLTANEAAVYLKIKPRTVLKWAKTGRIPGHPLSGKRRVTWRFLKSELDAMLTLPSAAEDRRLH